MTEGDVATTDEAPPLRTVPPKQLCYRPDDTQQRYLQEYLAKGWRPADLLRRIVGAQLVLEARTEDYRERLEAWGLRERVILPRERRDVGDASWLSEVVSRLALERLEQLDAAKK